MPWRDWRPGTARATCSRRNTWPRDNADAIEVPDEIQRLVKFLADLNGAHASFEEDRKGSIEVGKLADLAVLSEDIARMPVKELRDLPIAMTVVGGVVEYEG